MNLWPKRPYTQPILEKKKTLFVPEKINGTNFNVQISKNYDQR